jgi:hypothetical protein
MKTLIFGASMGSFGALAVFLSFTFGWPGWVLFMAWVCFYLFGKSLKKSLNIYLQIVLGIVLGILIETLGQFLSAVIGNMFGFYLAILLLIGSLAFSTKIKGLGDIAAWFIGLIVFFGAEPPLALVSVARTLLLPLAAGFLFGYGLDTFLDKFVHGGSSVRSTADEPLEASTQKN